jgi:hypothetical protein
MVCLQLQVIPWNTQLVQHIFVWHVEIYILSGNYVFFFWQSFLLTRRLFKGSVGERVNKLNFNLGLGCQSSNWFYPDLMLLTFVLEVTPWDMCIASIMQTWYLCLFHTQVYCKIKFVYPFTNRPFKKPQSQKTLLPKKKS